MKTFATQPRPEPHEERPCLLCGGSRLKALWRLEGFSFVRCASCGLVQQNPQPLPGAVLARYGADYLAYEVERQFAYRDLERLALADLGFDREEEALKAAALAEGRKPSIVDAGCATGALLADFAGRGWDSVGVEVCAEAVEWGRAHFGLDLRASTLEAARLDSASVDVVHASQVIEHLNDPMTFLVEARRILRPSGRLVLATPNAAGFQARVLGPAWRSAINDHLYLFSKRQLLALLEAAGFETLRVVTWGGWAAGLKPAFLKGPLDRAAKRFGLGDVMAVLARKRALP